MQTTGSIITQFQVISQSEIQKNRTAITPLIPGMAKCGPQHVFNVLQLCVAYIAVAHYKIRLIKKWPSRTELLAIPVIHCTHFLARNHIAHTTNFDKLVYLVVACGGESLKTFLETAGKKAQYTSKVAVVEFLDAIGTWVEETLLERLRQAPYYSIMADECT